MTWALLSIAGLTAVYLTALGEAAAGDLMLGVGFATVARWLVRPHTLKSPADQGPAPITRVLWLGPFVAIVIARGIGASVSFLGYLVSPERLEASGFVEVPFGERTPVGVAVTGLCVSLTPGAVLIDVDEDRKLMVFQLADAGRADAFATEQDDFYRRWQRRVAP
jgi:multicomponent Na+:H+ antiporter subunit E